MAGIRAAIGVLGRGAWTVDGDRKELIAKCDGCGIGRWSWLLERRQKERMSSVVLIGVARGAFLAILELAGWG
jgi:translation elongation factor EF-4